MQSWQWRFRLGSLNLKMSLFCWWLEEHRESLKFRCSQCFVSKSDIVFEANLCGIVRSRMCFNLLLAISKSFGNFLSQFSRSSQNGGNPAWKPFLSHSPFANGVRREGWRFGAKLVRGACHLDVFFCVPSFHALGKKNPGEQKGGLFGINCVTDDVHVFGQDFGKCLFFGGGSSVTTTPVIHSKVIPCRFRRQVHGVWTTKSHGTRPRLSNLWALATKSVGPSGFWELFASAHLELLGKMKKMCFLFPKIGHKSEILPIFASRW